MGVARSLRVVLSPEHLRRTGLITVVVGTWLTFFNQIDLIVAGPVDWQLLLKVVLNYVTPFVVSNAGLLSRQE